MCEAKCEFFLPAAYLSFSDNLHFWNKRKMLLKPMFPRELIGRDAMRGHLNTIAIAKRRVAVASLVESGSELLIWSEVR